MGMLGRLTAVSSEFLNKHGIYMGRRSTKLHAAIYRRTSGKMGNHIPGWPDTQILLLNHIGAKSGTQRTSPLMYREQDDGTVAVVASKAGQPTNPAWLHNLRTNPDATIEIGSDVRKVRARVATDEERDRLWPEFVAHFPGYEFYERNARGRKIPVVILEPR